MLETFLLLSNYLVQHFSRTEPEEKKMNLQKNKAESKLFNFDLELSYLKNVTLLHNIRLYVFMHKLLFVCFVSNQ